MSEGKVLAQEAGNHSFGDRIRLAIKRSDKISLIIALVVMAAIFQSLKSTYLLPENILNILISSSIVGMVAVGETYLMIAGQIDLSPGSVAAFSGVFAALLLQNNLNAGISIIIVLLAGCLIGLLNSLMITRLNIGFFIATLATQSILRGFAYIICNGKSIYIVNQSFIKIGILRIFGIPLPSVIFILIILVFGFVLAKTRFGRSTYMLGGNAYAARLAGINAKLRITLLFMMSSGLAAFGGIILASRMNSGQPSASSGLEFDAITAAVLGGVAISGGIGSMGGCLIGLLIMQGFNNGLQILNVQSFWQQVAKGFLLIVALTFDYLRNAQRQKSEYKGH